MSAGGFPFIAVPGSQVKSSKLPPGIPTGYCARAGDNGNVWATQCFVDELAHAAGRDPLAFTLDLVSAAPARRGGRGFDPAKMTAVIKLCDRKIRDGASRARVVKGRDWRSPTPRRLRGDRRRRHREP
jgi:isoquinoline 1-oxidoreductase beta subunit